VSAFDNVAAVASDFWAAPVLRDSSTGKLYCPGFVGDTYSNRAWDFVVFQSIVKTPGVCEVRVLKAQDADVKKAAGSDGATVTTHGVRPAEVDIAITLWTPDQWEELKSFWKLVMPRAGKDTGKAVDVTHPMLDNHGIKSIIVLRGEGPAKGNNPRTRVFTIHGLEYIAKTKKTATATPVASIGSRLDPDAGSNGQASPRALPGAAGRNTGP
jgi:hypothetical protein